MKLLTVAGGFVLVSSCAVIAGAVRPLPIDHPSPPPCGADGNCYPNEGEWGYYPGRWRQWPGVDLTPSAEEKAPTPAEQLGPDLSPYVTPSPEEEDEAAPPSTTKASDTEATPGQLGTQPTTDGVRPPAGPVPGGPPPRGAAPGGPAPGRSLPGPESPPTVPYSESTSDDDPPPSVPAALTAGAAPAAEGASQAAHIDVLQPPRNNDPPPAPTWLYRSASL